MTTPLDHTGSTERRLDRVETDVAALSAAMIEVRTDVRGFGQALNTIIDTLKTRDREQAESARAAKLNPLALASVLVTMIIALIGGAWATGSQYARLDERDIQRDKEMARVHREIEKIESRTYRMKGMGQ